MSNVADPTILRVLRSSTDANALLVAGGEDLRRRDRPDPGQRVELLRGGGVQIDRAAAGAAPPSRPARRSAGRKPAPAGSSRDGTTT